MTSDLHIRRRRAAYRAAHRGTKEMDWLLGRYADTHIEFMDEAELAQFECLLELPDPELQSWIFDKAAITRFEYMEFVERLRIFHGLETSLKPKK